MEKKEPIRPYFVQRASLRKYGADEMKGIDRLLSFDYMGSAEFEFGALNKSLLSIRDNIAAYDYFPLTIGNKQFTVFCKTEDKDEIAEVIKGLWEKKFRLKEWCDLEDVRTDHWWDIGNDFMFWKENESFTTEFKAVIG